MTKRKIYDNILKTPFQTFRLYTTSPENFNKYKTELKSKEEALFAHYGLSRPKKLNEETRALIRKMAQDLKIRGFFHNDEINEVGRPRKWKTSYEKSILFIIVEHYKKQHPDKSLANIIEIVARKYYPEQNPRVLYVRYEEIIKTKPIKELAEQVKKDGIDPTFLRWAIDARKYLIKNSQ